MEYVLITCDGYKVKGKMPDEDLINFMDDKKKVDSPLKDYPIAVETEDGIWCRKAPKATKKRGTKKNG